MELGPGAARTLAMGRRAGEVRRAAQSINEGMQPGGREVGAGVESGVWRCVGGRE